MNMYSRSFTVGEKRYRINKVKMYTNLLVLCLGIFGLIILNQDVDNMVNINTPNVVVDNISVDKETTSLTTYKTWDVPVVDMKFIYGEKIDEMNRIVPLCVNNKEAQELAKKVAKIDYANRFRSIPGNNKRLKDKWIVYLEKECKRNNLSFELMLGIMSGESQGYPRLVNKSSQATGLFQIMPGTFYWLSKDVFKDGAKFSDMKNPYMNIKYGCKRFRIALDERRTLHKALYSFGGCVSYDKKMGYKRYINKNLRLATGKTLKDIKI